MRNDGNHPKHILSEQMLMTDTNKKLTQNQDIIPFGSYEMGQPKIKKSSKSRGQSKLDSKTSKSAKFTSSMTNTSAPPKQIHNPVE